MPYEGYNYYLGDFGLLDYFWIKLSLYACFYSSIMMPNLYTHHLPLSFSLYSPTQWLHDECKQQHLKHKCSRFPNLYVYL